MSTNPGPEPQWPPPWARSIAFFLGLALMIYETVFDHAQNLVVYGPAFALTGLPIARGVDSLLDKLPWGGSSSPPPPPPPSPELPPPTDFKALPSPEDDVLEGW